MESIKEKAEELEIEVFRTTRSKDVAEKCKWSYIKGAKYVLEQILDKTARCNNIDDAFEAFLECVEQLKK